MLKSDFNFPQPDIIMIAVNLASSVTRDLSEFANRGVPALLVTKI